MITNCTAGNCQAPIEFATNADDLDAAKEKPRRIPLDVDRSGDEFGAFAAWNDDTRGGQLVYRSWPKDPDRIPAGASRRVSHYTTCTSPGQFSKRSRAAK